MDMEPKPYKGQPNVIPSHFPGDSPIDRAAPARYARETGPHVTANVRAVRRCRRCRCAPRCSGNWRDMPIQALGIAALAWTRSPKPWR